MGGIIAVAIGVWWNANTVSHLFIHRPFCRRRAANAWFAALLTAALGIPQSLWRDRHLAHHRGARYQLRVTSEIALQAALVLSLWALMAVMAPVFFTAIYLPGYVLGMLLCAVHGHYEHAGGTTSHYGRLYNALCFNDGYHVEHHRHPSAAWWTLPRYRESSARASAWPPPLRWLEPAASNLRPSPNLRPLAGDGAWAGDGGWLAALERVVLRSRLLQRWVVGVHAHAFEGLLAAAPPARHVAIVGGGLFPRTALIVRRLLPDARITIVDASLPNLDRARAIIQDDAIDFVHAHFMADVQLTCDVVVLPLSFDGDRSAVYARPPAATVIVHDWLWRKRGTSRVVSPLLLKRVNLVRACLP